MSRSSLSSHFDESNIPISSSWVSDGARSDASHVLYKELDPLNKATSMELDKENNTVFYKEGGWITVAEPSNGKYATSVSNYHFSKLLLIGLRSVCFVFCHVNVYIYLNCFRTPQHLKKTPR
ncbi:unnamed protein product [Schistosoma curassoni]|uniref:DUF4767 domain-containing protein n=1 Tax=Schistosoma curassoni TaxID=6186 RepID=A0A183L5Q3_9TREM|nr:unnamed protein product [Schistosoma curassoni]